eukprot:CAMPEP_0197557592 /NCGR_PEP_ID=MMETSP1320-20131121/17407_1 /TAXON_ID=91990 /ORGANISM="Bolidomonas sp., Strain RCC2347" /LENGTH=52 /DNA_ID=CAMNT_0043118843 /DNA_START=18 /DNA_END=173 /DNA_ORIENTATION=+
MPSEEVRSGEERSDELKKRRRDDTANNVENTTFHATRYDSSQSSGSRSTNMW